MNLFAITTQLKSRYPVVRESVEPHPQRAAVLVILFAKRGEAHTVMTKRALDLKVHAGEIAFPGGVVEPDDPDLLATALRETEEEIGVEVSPAQVIGRLPTVETLTGFEIAPFVCQVDAALRYRPCPDEVDAVLEIPLAALLSTQQRDIGFKESDGMVVYWHKHHRIWGASAKILQQIESLHVL